MGRSCKVYYLLTIPYDGKLVGSFGEDRFQGHWHKDLVLTDNAIKFDGYFQYGNNKWGAALSDISGNLIIADAISDETNGVPRKGVETNPAYISEARYIQY